MFLFFLQKKICVSRVDVVSLSVVIKQRNEEVFMSIGYEAPQWPGPNEVTGTYVSKRVEVDVKCGHYARFLLEWMQTDKMYRNVPSDRAEYRFRRDVIGRWVAIDWRIDKRSSFQPFVCVEAVSLGPGWWRTIDGKEATRFQELDFLRGYHRREIKREDAVDYYTEVYLTAYGPDELTRRLRLEEIEMAIWRWERQVATRFDDIYDLSVEAARQASCDWEEMIADSDVWLNRMLDPAQMNYKYIYGLLREYDIDVDATKEEVSNG